MYLGLGESTYQVRELVEALGIGHVDGELGVVFTDLNELLEEHKATEHLLLGGVDFSCQNKRGKTLL